MQQEMFCQMTESIYNALVAAIETALALPIQFLRSIESVIRKVELIILSAIESQLEALENQLFLFLDNEGLNPDTSEQKQSFCAALFACSALKDSLFDPTDTTGNSDAIFVKFMPLSVRNEIRGDSGAYGTFEKYVCKLSLRALLDQYIDAALLQIAEVLQELRDQLLDALNIDEYISQYEEFLQTPIPGLNKNIFELMDELDKFAQCAFGVCNFIFTSSNQQEEFAAKAYIEKNGGEWVVNLKELTKTMDENGEILLNKIDELLAFADGSKDKPKGISADEVMLS
jgi:hypothetical protein